MSGTKAKATMKPTAKRPAAPASASASGVDALLPLLPTAVLSSIFAWLDLRAHIAFCRTNRRVHSASLLPTSSPAEIILFERHTIGWWLAAEAEEAVAKQK